jgi:hypothetical protein
MATDMEPPGGDLSDNGATIPPQSSSINQETLLKGQIQVTIAMSARPISAPALLPSLEEHMEHVERRLGYWGRVFEDAVHPEAYNSCYCGFLVNPERVYKIQTAVNTRLEALKNSVLPPFIIGGDGKLVTNFRLQLSPKYFTRRNRTLSPLISHIATTSNNKFPPACRNTDIVHEENKEDNFSTSLIKFWETSGLIMDGSADAERPLGQNASHKAGQHSRNVSK